MRNIFKRKLRVLKDGTVVEYHGSMTHLHGVKFTTINPQKDAAPNDADWASKDGWRYTLLPVQAGAVSRSWREDYIYNVRRQSFTVLSEPAEDVEHDCD